jgi:hypothetical protein
MAAQNEIIQKLLEATEEVRNEIPDSVQNLCEKFVKSAVRSSSSDTLPDRDGRPVSITEQSTEALDNSLGLSIDKKLERLGPSLESRLEKKIDKKITTSIERKLKLHEDFGK